MEDQDQNNRDSEKVKPENNKKRRKTYENMSSKYLKSILRNSSKRGFSNYAETSLYQEPSTSFAPSAHVNTSANLQSSTPVQSVSDDVTAYLQPTTSVELPATTSTNSTLVEPPAITSANLQSSTPVQAVSDDVTAYLQPTTLVELPATTSTYSTLVEPPAITSAYLQFSPLVVTPAYVGASSSNQLNETDFQKELQNWAVGRHDGHGWTVEDLEMITHDSILKRGLRDSTVHLFLLLTDYHSLDQDLDVTLTPEDIQRADEVFQDDLQCISLKCNSDQRSISREGNTASEYGDIMAELREIRSLVTFTMHRVRKIEQLLQIGRQSETMKSLLPTLPLMELTQLKTFEENLADENIKQQLFDLLRFTGGSKERDCVNRTMEKIFSNYLAQFCSWTGKKNNFKLSTLKLMTTIKLAVKESFPNMTDESFERHVMSWFQHATTRLKRQKNE